VSVAGVYLIITCFDTDCPPFSNSLHRTPSQRTIATQLSIPISTSNHALSNAQDGLTSQTASSLGTETATSGSSILPSITTTAPTYEPEERGITSSEAIKADANQIASTAQGVN
jgi:hypothetical protein